MLLHPRLDCEVHIWRCLQNCPDDVRSLADGSWAEVVGDVGNGSCSRGNILHEDVKAHATLLLLLSSASALTRPAQDTGRCPKRLAWRLVIVAANSLAVPNGRER